MDPDFVVAAKTDERFHPGTGESSSWLQNVASNDDD
jgi:hypothetical protein